MRKKSLVLIMMGIILMISGCVTNHEIEPDPNILGKKQNQWYLDTYVLGNPFSMLENFSVKSSNVKYVKDNVPESSKMNISYENRKVLEISQETSNREGSKIEVKYNPNGTIQSYKSYLKGNDNNEIEMVSVRTYNYVLPNLFQIESYTDKTNYGGIETTSKTTFFYSFGKIIRSECGKITSDSEFQLLSKTEYLYDEDNYGRLSQIVVSYLNDDKSYTINSKNTINYDEIGRISKVSTEIRGASGAFENRYYCQYVYDTKDRIILLNLYKNNDTNTGFDMLNSTEYLY